MKKPSSVIKSHDHYANQIPQAPSQPVKPVQQPNPFASAGAAKTNPVAPTKATPLNPLKGVIKGGKG